MSIACRTKVLGMAMLLLSPALWAQMPPQPGKLVISSEPSGAIVTINGQKMTQPTNATFVVSAGTYKVSVATADGVLVCSQVTLSVSGGQTALRHCTAKGWQ
jgi:hypothetical protein